MNDVLTWIGVCVGAGTGAVIRAWADRGVAARVPMQRLPWATLAVNIAGSLLLGALLAMSQAPDADSTTARWFAILATGLCGGLTTFSTFTWEAFTLMREGEPRTAVSYGLVTVLLTLVAVSLGVWFGQRTW